MFGSILLVILITYIYYIKLWHPDYKILMYKDIKDKAKSGDIILFSTLDSFNQIIMGSYITHIGVIYRKDPESAPVLIESFNNFRMPCYPKEFKHGIAACDLETRINSYRGYCMYKELHLPITEHANNDFLDFIKFSQKNMKYDYDVISNEIYKMLFNTPFTTKTNCGQFTALILMKINLLDFSHFKNTTKHHLIWTANLTQLKKNHYYDPVYVYQKYFKVVTL